MESLAIQAAVAFATMAHKNQKYGEEPYTVHLKHVHDVLKRFKVDDEEILIAAWLHDTLEDTEATYFQIESTFGVGVADLVYRVTNEVGKNRKERHVKTYPKIQGSDRAITLKLADRIANTERSVDTQDPILEMYAKEYTGFREAFHKPGHNEAMWRHLDFLMGENRG